MTVSFIDGENPEKMVPDFISDITYIGKGTSVARIRLSFENIFSIHLFETIVILPENCLYLFKKNCIEINGAVTTAITW